MGLVVDPFWLGIGIGLAFPFVLLSILVIVFAAWILTVILFR